MAAPRQPMFWYEMPGHIHIRLLPEEVIVSPMGHDTDLRKKVGDKLLKALVPTHTVHDCGDGTKYVPANIAGKKDDLLILHLPTSNDGRPTWVVQEDQLKEILVDPHNSPVGQEKLIQANTD